MFLKILPGIREKILQYCSCSDLRSLSCCSKEYYQYLKPMLWRHLSINLYQLSKKDFAHKKRLRNLKHTWRVRFSGDGEGLAESPGHFPCRKKERKIVNNIMIILKQCDPDVLCAFQISLVKMIVDVEHIVEAVCHMFDQLKIFHITHCSLTSTSLQSITVLHKLTALNVLGTDIDDDALLLISENLSTLEDLNIGCTKISDDGLPYLQNLLKLKTLCLQGCHITNRGVLAISSLIQLEDVQLSDCLDISDAGICSLTQLQCLRRLNISWTMVKDGGVSQLPRLKNLCHLEVVGTALTDNSVNYFFKIPRLKFLDIRETNITDIGVEHLLRAKYPDAVCLSGNKCC